MIDTRKIGYVKKTVYRSFYGLHAESHSITSEERQDCKNLRILYYVVYNCILIWLMSSPINSAPYCCMKTGFSEKCCTGVSSNTVNFCLNFSDSLNCLSLYCKGKNLEH